MSGGAGALVLEFAALALPTGPGQECAPDGTSDTAIERSDFFGDWVASAGDLDGDGTDDLMIGGLSTWLFSGSDGSFLRVMEAGHPAGDVDEDGLADLASVEPDGRLRLRSLREGSVIWSRLPEPWTPPDRGPGIHQVVAAGDVDADGRPDLAATVIVYDGNGRGLGSVVLLSGRTGESLRWIRTDDVEGYPLAVAGVGDTDGDGHADVAVVWYFHRAPLAIRSLEHRAQLRRDVPHDAALYSGATGELLHAVKLDRPWPRACAVAPAGDQDGDGHPDWLLGASLLGPQSDGGLVVLVSGHSGTVVRTTEVEGGEIRSIAALDDLDGDGTRDFAAGTSGGGLNGMTGVFSGTTGKALQRFVGEVPYPYLGWSLSEVSDLDGDGTRELLISATNPWHHPLAGYAEVRSPDDGTLLWRLRAP